MIKNKFKPITAKIWAELGENAEATINWIWKNKNAILPFDYCITKDELLSEAYYQMGYLINNYKPGPLSIKSYVFKYLRLKIVDSIYKDYNSFKNEVLQEDNIDEIDIFKNISLTKNIENKDFVNLILASAKDDIDRKIINGIIDGKSYDEISDDTNINKSAVFKRLKKMSENENLIRRTQNEI